MASSRADEVAEILWELKRAGKIASYSHIARRAGFSAGSNGRAMDTCLRVVRRDWPHLHWWRAIKDDGLLESNSEQLNKLLEAGYQIEVVEKQSVLISLESHLMTWGEQPAAVGAGAATAEAAEAK